MSSVLKIFKDTSMSLGHTGLSNIAKEAGHTIAKIEVGEFYIFINKRKTAFKLFAANNVVAHYKSPTNSAIQLAALASIPKVFGAKGALSFDEALKQYLQQRLK